MSSTKTTVLIYSSTSWCLTGKAHALQLPSRSLFSNSCENQRNKLEDAAPLSHLTEICLWLRSLPWMSGQTHVLSSSPLFLQKKGSKVTMLNYHPQWRGQVSTPAHLGLILLDRNNSARGKEEDRRATFLCCCDFQSHTKITVFKGEDLDFSTDICSLVVMCWCKV